MTLEYRIGQGHDTHRLVSGRKLILGNVTIEHDKGLDGHSDADILLHALTDALLGAAGLGDIGEWFPNTDPQWQGVDSSIFVKEAHKAIRLQQWEIVNLDCTIWAEQPKLAPYKSIIEEQLAAMLDLSEDVINVKAKTGEKVGIIGREEAMQADVIVLLQRQAS